MGAKFKVWLISTIAGPLGFAIRPVIAAFLGVLIGAIYEQAWIVVYKVALLKWIAVQTIAALDPSVVQLFTPKAVAASAAIALWGFGADWLIAKLKGGVKEIQVANNANPNTPNVRVDGIALAGGQTASAVAPAISRADYETIYPTDTATRGGGGMLEIRKPLP